MATHSSKKGKCGDVGVRAMWPPFECACGIWLIHDSANVDIGEATVKVGDKAMLC